MGIASKFSPPFFSSRLTRYTTPPPHKHTHTKKETNKQTMSHVDECILRQAGFGSLRFQYTEGCTQSPMHSSHLPSSPSDRCQFKPARCRCKESRQTDTELERRHTGQMKEDAYDREWNQKITKKPHRVTFSTTLTRESSFTKRNKFVERRRKTENRSERMNTQG